MQLSGVRPTVCLSVCPSCGFAAVDPASRRYRSIAALPALSNSRSGVRRPDAGSVTLSADVGTVGS